MPTPQREPLRRLSRTERAALQRIARSTSERVDQVRRATALLAVARPGVWPWAQTYLFHQRTRTDCRNRATGTEPTHRWNGDAVAEYVAADVAASRSSTSRHSTWVLPEWGHFGGNHSDRRQNSADYGELVPEHLRANACHSGSSRTAVKGVSEAWASSPLPHPPRSRRLELSSDSEHLQRQLSVVETNWARRRATKISSNRLLPVLAMLALAVEIAGAAWPLQSQAPSLLRGLAPFSRP
jgi:hypothetical protein